MSEEDDYMADLSVFIPGYKKEETTYEESPLTCLEHVHKQRNLGENKKAFKEKKRKQVESVESRLRNSGLSTAIPSSNIGFKLLQKQGYTPGKGLGNGIHVRSEPIEVDLKRGRGGLGIDAVLREKAKMLEEKEKKKIEEFQMNSLVIEKEFHEMRKVKWESKKIARDVAKAKSALRDLADKDEKERLNENETKGIEGLIESDLLEEDILVECEEKLHKRIKPFTYEIEEENLKEEKEVQVEEPTMELLNELLDILREKYFFCIYCGCKYKSQEDMKSNCPGKEDDLH